MGSLSLLIFFSILPFTSSCTPVACSFQPHFHEQYPGSSPYQLGLSLVGLYLHTAQKAACFLSSGRNPLCFLGNRLYVHLGVRILSLVLEFIYFILNSNGEEIQHPTAPEVCNSFPEITCFPLSLSVYRVTWETPEKIIIIEFFLCIRSDSKNSLTLT